MANYVKDVLADLSKQLAVLLHKKKESSTKTPEELAEVQRGVDSEIVSRAQSIANETFVSSLKHMQRFFVLLSRDFFGDLIDRLIEVAQRHGRQNEEGPRGAENLPSTKDREVSVSSKESLICRLVEELHDDTVDFFVTETFHLSLVASLGASLDTFNAAAAEKVSPVVFKAIMDFCLSHLDVGYNEAVRHEAAETLGVLSLAKPQPIVDAIMNAMDKSVGVSAKKKDKNADAMQRWFVPTQRAMRSVVLAFTPSHAPSTLYYLKRLAKALPFVERGVLRSEICSTISEMITNHMLDDSGNNSEAFDLFLKSGDQASEFWSIMLDIFQSLLKWAKNKKHVAPTLRALCNMVVVGDNDFYVAVKEEFILKLLEAVDRKDTRVEALETTKLFVQRLRSDIVAADLEAFLDTLQLILNGLFPKKSSPDEHECLALTEVFLEIARRHVGYAIRVVSELLRDDIYSNAQKGIALRVLGVLVEEHKEDILNAREDLSPLVMQYLEKPSEYILVRPALRCFPSLSLPVLSVNEQEGISASAVTMTIKKLERQLKCVCLLCANSDRETSGAAIESLQSYIQGGVPPNVGSSSTFRASNTWLTRTCEVLFYLTQLLYNVEKRGVEDGLRVFNTLNILLDDLNAALEEIPKDSDVYLKRVKNDWTVTRGRIEAAAIIWMCHPEQFMREQAVRLLEHYNKPSIRSIEGVGDDVFLGSTLSDVMSEAAKDDAFSDEGVWSKSMTTLLREKWEKHEDAIKTAWQNIAERWSPDESAEDPMMEEEFRMWRNHLRFLTLAVRDWKTGQDSLNALRKVFFKEVIRTCLSETTQRVHSTLMACFSLFHEGVTSLITAEMDDLVREDIAPEGVDLDEDKKAAMEEMIREKISFHPVLLRIFSRLLIRMEDAQLRRQPHSIMDTLAFMVEKWVQAIQDNKPSVRQESIPHAARLVYIYYRSVMTGTLKRDPIPGFQTLRLLALWFASVGRTTERSHTELVGTVLVRALAMLLRTTTLEDDSNEPEEALGLLTKAHSLHTDPEYRDVVGEGVYCLLACSPSALPLLCKKCAEGDAQSDFSVCIAKALLAAYEDLTVKEQREDPAAINPAEVASWLRGENGVSFAFVLASTLMCSSDANQRQRGVYLALSLAKPCPFWDAAAEQREKEREGEAEEDEEEEEPPVILEVPPSHRPLSYHRLATVHVESTFKYGAAVATKFKFLSGEILHAIASIIESSSHAQKECLLRIALPFTRHFSLFTKVGETEGASSPMGFLSSVYSISAHCDEQFLTFLIKTLWGEIAGSCADNKEVFSIIIGFLLNKYAIACEREENEEEANEENPPLPSSGPSAVVERDIIHKIFLYFCKSSTRKLIAEILSENLRNYQYSPFLSGHDFTEEELLEKHILQGKKDEAPTLKEFAAFAILVDLLHELTDTLVELEASLTWKPLTILLLNAIVLFENDTSAPLFEELENHFIVSFASRWMPQDKEIAEKKNALIEACDGERKHASCPAWTVSFFGSGDDIGDRERKLVSFLSKTIFASSLVKDKAEILPLATMAETWALVTGDALVRSRSLYLYSAFQPVLEPMTVRRLSPMMFLGVAHSSKLEVDAMSSLLRRLGSAETAEVSSLRLLGEFSLAMSSVIQTRPDSFGLWVQTINQVWDKIEEKGEDALKQLEAALVKQLSSNGKQTADEALLSIIFKGFTAVEKDVWEPTLSLFHRLMISIAPTVKARNRAAIGLLMVFCALARRAERESEEGRIENYDSLSKVAVKALEFLVDYSQASKVDEGAVDEIESFKPVVEAFQPIFQRLLSGKYRTAVKKVERRKTILQRKSSATLRVVKEAQADSGGAKKTTRRMSMRQQSLLSGGAASPASKAESNSLLHDFCDAMKASFVDDSEGMMSCVAVLCALLLGRNNMWRAPVLDLLIPLLEAFGTDIPPKAVSYLSDVLYTCMHVPELTAKSALALAKSIKYCGAVMSGGVDFLIPPLKVDPLLAVLEPKGVTFSKVPDGERLLWSLKQMMAIFLPEKAADRIEELWRRARGSANP